VPTRVVYYAAMSLDGRIAGPDHDLSFLQTLDGGNDYLTFYEGVDSLIMGARTWDFMVLHGSWPYDKPTWVVTNADELDVVGTFEGAVVETFAGDVAELVDLIGDRGYERAWLIGGGDLAGQFLAADLLDELILTVAPTLVGRGPALADGEFRLPRFTLAEVERFGNDGARLRYVRRDDATA
jgi:dihydrofolate reductase